MNKKTTKRKQVAIVYGNGLKIDNLTKGEALKIAAELLQEFETITINNKPLKDGTIN